MTYPSEVLARPFGRESRALLMESHFAPRGAGRGERAGEPEAHRIESANAWKHVYRLLLWIDPTTSLAHCYESDKAQPGRRWYERALAFHKWVSGELGVAPRELHREIDYLFKGAMKIAAVAMAEEVERRRQRAEEQRARVGPELPAPAEDPELADAIDAALREHYGRSPEPGLVATIIRLVKAAVSQENKRKNLLGEGFEDVLGEVMRRVDTAERVDVACRKRLQEVPGFREPARGEKERTVDLAIVAKRSGRRTLATVKWSVRADREEQFEVDYEAYARMEHSGEAFDFVFITNEFDAARLVAACRRRHAGKALFDRVVHMNPQGLLAVHGWPGARGASAELPVLISSGRLSSFGAWIDEVLAG